jgi:hypothetical protein
MLFRRLRLLAAAALLSLSGCEAYDPQVQGDHTTEKYQTDLKSCQETSQHAVYIKNADNPFSWAISPFTGPPAVRKAIITCMAGKGYVIDAP